MKHLFLLITPVIILCGLIISSLLFMLQAARQDSAIMDELAHIPASYSYVKYLDYRLNPEHPPLVKILAGLPLLFLHNLHFPTDQSSWLTGVNGQWQTGTQFLYESGNNADQIIFWARIGPMLLTLLLIGFVYWWGQELVGRWWALLPSFLISFSPNFLAHGHYVTTDIGATLGILLALYAFVRYLQHPSGRWLFLSGIAFGIAQLMKFSAILLIPVFVALLFLVYLQKNIRLWLDPTAQSRWKKISQWFFVDYLKLFFIFGIGFLVVYLVYLPLVWHYPIEKQVADTTSILNSSQTSFLANFDITLTRHSLTRSFAQYLLGILIVNQRSNDGNTAYFLGEISNIGSWYYFPVVFLLKEPLPSLLLIGVILCIGLFRCFLITLQGWHYLWKKYGEYLETHLPEIALLAFILIYWGYSMRSPLNIGVRHILPTLPCFYLLIARGLKSWFSIAPVSFPTTIREHIVNFFHNFLSTALQYGALGILLFWLILETSFSAPYFLSYFNLLSGRTTEGYHYVTDSNFDWGQDLKRLTEWSRTHLQSNEKIAIDYFGGGNLSYYFGDQAESWSSSRGNPFEQNIHWLAISAHTLQSAIAKTHIGFIRKEEDEYSWLNEPYTPTVLAGTSIFIYQLPR